MSSAPSSSTCSSQPHRTGLSTRKCLLWTSHISRNLVTVCTFHWYEDLVLWNLYPFWRRQGELVALQVRALIKTIFYSATLALKPCYTCIGATQCLSRPSSWPYMHRPKRGMRVLSLESTARSSLPQSGTSLVDISFHFELKVKKIFVFLTYS